MNFELKTRRLDLSEPAVMGILNVTPDSFSDGGRFKGVDAALRHAEQMLVEGARIIDVGGESTRPGARSVSVNEELDRVLPVVEAIKAKLDVAVSVDTSQPEVAETAIALGIDLINDVRALAREGMAELVVTNDMPVCLMHMQGQPATMQAAPSYGSVVEDVCNFLDDRAKRLEQMGLASSRIILDPGFGFGKRLEDNLHLLAELRRIEQLGFPILVGLSRKSMLGQLTGRQVAERLAGSVAAATISVLHGASILRVHDVAETVDAIKIANAIIRME
ncbi:MAG: dihydropteroate synthase [Hahellaceae bacterium]|nr:dihydropteroate synthase [Hahellaceae bacterium]